MWPDLVTIPVLNLPIHTYGVLIVSGFLIAMYVSYRQAMRSGKMANDILDFGFWALLSAMIGGRLVYLLVDFRKYFIDEPFVALGNTGIKIPVVLAFWEGGIVFLGGLFGAFIAFLIFTHKRKLNKLQFADLAALSIPLAQALGRLGCIAAGCCYGKPMYHVGSDGQILSNLPLAMQFPQSTAPFSGLMASSPYDQQLLMQKLGHTLPLFPSQLAESFGCLALFFILLFMSRRKHFHGQIFLAYALGYSILRSILEMYRGDVIRGFVIEGVLSTSQFMSIILVVATLVTIWFNRDKKEAH